MKQMKKKVYFPWMSPFHFLITLMLLLGGLLLFSELGEGQEQVVHIIGFLFFIVGAVSCGVYHEVEV